MIYRIHAIHGHNNVYNATIFPHYIGLGATSELLVIWRSFPLLQSNKLSHCRSFINDIVIIKFPIHKGTQFVSAYAKHYMGDGGTTQGLNENNTVINWHGMLARLLHAIIIGVSATMVSYSSWSSVKMDANLDLVTGFLKNTLKFRVKFLSNKFNIDFFSDSY
ncbi:hypothetical protein Cgig2_019121 [Carnegiea gigantea]|uniref:beta-glucosidase n=1 Tax=Carnegiea gigantea TaxID=171969 RepID=A0A9Q1GTL5_9CARY|nr:hypothetical protein Cgig2_019121 [Carnegiea gigantea]